VKRRPYTTAGFAAKRVIRNGRAETDINVWNGTVFADSDEMARTLTLGAMLIEWPMKDGWERHTAFVRLIDDACVLAWMAEQ
jgi:hypothetical protein